MTPRLYAMFFTFVPGGLAWSSWLLAQNEWVRLLSFVIGLGCSIVFVFLAVDEVLEKLRSYRYASWHATEGRMYDYMIKFTQALAMMSGSTATEIFRVAVLRVRGLPGVPTTWDMSLSTRGVALGLFVEYMRACVDCYDDSRGHLWPIREHQHPRFSAWIQVEQQMTDITSWMITNGYAIPVHGNQSAMWCNGYHPVDILDEMVLNHLRSML